MEITDTMRLRTRELAIRIRLEELSRELRRTQVRVLQLESHLEDARLAKMMGEATADAAAIGSELERSRGDLESQQELITSVKDSLRDARAEWGKAKMKEINEALRRRSEQA